MASPSVVFMMPQGRLAQVGLHPEVTRFHTLSSPLCAPLPAAVARYVES